MGLIFVPIGIMTIFIGVIGYTTNTSKVITALFGLIMAGVPWILTILPILLPNLFYLITYIIGIICATIISIFIYYMPKRTKYGNEMLGKIRGFKRFLETAEKEQLETLVEKNPEYFYNILPYTYALGVSDKWVKQFESIAIKEPEWYDSQNGFSMNTFGSFIDTTMSSVSTAMTSSPSSDSGGGSSGGGSGGGRRRLLVKLIIQKGENNARNIKRTK